MKLETIICAKGVAVDARTNTVSVFSILEELTPASFPAFIPELSVLALLNRGESEPEGFTVRLTVFLNDDVLLNQSMEISFQGKTNVRAIFEMRGMPILRPGKLVFQLEDPRGKTLGSTRIHVTGRGAPSQRELDFERAAKQQQKLPLR